MKKRCIAALAMAVVLLYGVCPFASAAFSSEEAIASDENSSPTRWANVSSVNLGLSFSGTTATCSGSITGYSGTTKITATYVLRRKNSNGTYTVVKTFPTQTVNGSTLRFSGTASITTGYTYRLTVTATVTRNGTNETVTNWLEKKA
ncbi:MAG: hypothetical protein FWH04_08790 [Oscillospiraceae bacterium]|nr:hypothetical protein [Oscillospiraceae bacterium]